MKIAGIFEKCKAIYIIVVVIYCYLERDDDKNIKSILNKSSFFKISTSLF